MMAFVGGRRYQKGYKQGPIGDTWYNLSMKRMTPNFLYEDRLEINQSILHLAFLSEHPAFGFTAEHIVPAFTYCLIYKLHPVSSNSFKKKKKLRVMFFS